MQISKFYRVNENANIIVTRAKDVLPKINRMQAAEITPPPPATQWSRLLLYYVICSQRLPLRRCWG